MRQQNAPFKIENVQRHRLPDGRAYTSAEVVLADARAGVDNVCGSWSIYETTDGSPLTGRPGQRNETRRGVLAFAAKHLQDAAAKLPPVA